MAVPGKDVKVSVEVQNALKHKNIAFKDITEVLEYLTINNCKTLKLLEKLYLKQNDSLSKIMEDLMVGVEKKEVIPAVQLIIVAERLGESDLVFELCKKAENFSKVARKKWGEILEKITDHSATVFCLTPNGDSNRLQHSLTWSYQQLDSSNREIRELTNAKIKLIPNMNLVKPDTKMANK